MSWLDYCIKNNQAYLWENMMSSHKTLINFKYDVTVLNYGICWCHRVSVPLVEAKDMEQRNYLTLLTRALISNDVDIKVQHQITHITPDLRVESSYNPQLDDAWIYTRELSDSQLKKSTHKSQKTILVGQTESKYAEQVIVCEELKQQLMLLDPRLHWSIVVDDTDITVTDGIQFISGQIIGLEHLFRVTEKHSRWA